MSNDTEALENDQRKFLNAEVGRVIGFVTRRLEQLDAANPSTNADDNEIAMLHHTLGNLEHMVYMRTVHDRCDENVYSDGSPVVILGKIPHDYETDIPVEIDQDIDYSRRLFGGDFETITDALRELSPPPGWGVVVAEPPR